MDKKELLQGKLVELYQVNEITMSEQYRLINGERIKSLLEKDPLEVIHLGDMQNRLALQKRKQEELVNRESAFDISDVIERLNNEVSILEEIINLYEDIQR